MEIRGAAAPCAHGLAEAAGEAIFSGRPVLLWSDGQDVVMIEAGTQDNAGDVLKMAARMLVEFRQ